MTLDNASDEEDAGFPMTYHLMTSLTAVSMRSQSQQKTREGLEVGDPSHHRDSAHSGVCLEEVYADIPRWSEDHHRQGRSHNVV